MRTGDILQLKLSGKAKGTLTYGIYLGRERGEKEPLYRVFTRKGILKLKRKTVNPVEDVEGYQGNPKDTGSMERFLIKVTQGMKKRSVRDQDRLLMAPREILRQVKPRALWQSVVNYASLMRDQDSETDERVLGKERIAKLSTDPGSSMPVLANTGDHIFQQPITAETIATVYFHPKILDKSQLNAVADILKPFQESGNPYFLKGSQHNTYLIYTSEVMNKVQEHIERLNDLKARFVEWVEGYDEFEEDVTGIGKKGKVKGKEMGKEYGKEKGKRYENEKGKGIVQRDAASAAPRKGKRRRIPKLIVDDPSLVQLNANQRELLNQLIQWSKDYFLQGGWENIRDFGLGGTPIIHLQKFSLLRYLEFFGWDLAGARILELPSALLEFLLRMGSITWKEASGLLLSYNVLSRKVPFFLSFPGPVLNEAGRLPGIPDKKDYTGRKDLRDTECFTIDPVDAKDFDDAVGFREFVDPVDKMKKVELMVHIADVSHYVKPEHAIDDEARRRCTSVYLPTGVLPMLPPQLSEDLCSLRAGEDRLTFSTRMIFDAQSAKLVEWEHFRSIIRVNENLSYDYVDQDVARNSESIFASMVRFSRKLEERNHRLDIVTQERKISFPPDGSGLTVTLKSPTPATRMIEQFMVTTNEAVARTLFEAKTPSVYRIHPLPDRPDVEQWNAMCDAMGLEDVKLNIDFDSLNRSYDATDDDKVARIGDTKEEDIISLLQSGGTLTLSGFGDSVGEIVKKNVAKGRDIHRKNGEKEENPEDETDNGEPASRSMSFGELKPMDPEDLKAVGEAYRTALKAISGKDEGLKNLLYDRILSTMPRAVYSVNNHGHFGLNSLCYTHFTSPIRRYPDVLVHRILGDVISSKDIDTQERELLTEELKVMVEICNEQSKEAEDLERMMIDVALTTRATMDKDYRYAIHDCHITGLTPTSCFLSIDGATEGRIPLSRLSKFRLGLDESQSRIMLDAWENKDMNEHEIKDFLERRRKLREKSLVLKAQSVKGDARGEVRRDLADEGTGEGIVGARSVLPSEEKGGEVGDGQGEGEMEGMDEKMRNVTSEEKGSNRSDGWGEMRGEVSSGVTDDEYQSMEIFRLGQRVRCRIHSVELSEGLVDLSLAE